jgi:hypothetical protein
METATEISIWDLCQELGYETTTGRINFSSPFYKLVCNHLGIKWSQLSRTGKAVLKGNAIETYKSGKYRQQDFISDVNYLEL